MKNKTISPWAWIPTLYFAQGLPYVAVMTISVIMYKNLGISNTDIALYTSWLYLPWVIKPFWSPFVDLLKTKRWWVISMQLLVGAGLAGIAFTIPMPNFFQTTLAGTVSDTNSSGATQFNLMANHFYALGVKGATGSVDGGTPGNPGDDDAPVDLLTDQNIVITISPAWELIHNLVIQ